MGAGGKNYEYSNIEYLQMVRLYAKADYNSSEARRLYAAPDNIQMLRKQGIPDPKIPATSTIQATSQRLIDFGQFRTPDHARGLGRSPKSIVLEEKILEYCERNPERSTRHVGRHFGVSPTYVWNIYKELVFKQRGKSQSTGTTYDQPSTSAAAEFQYQPSRYAMVSADQGGDEGDALEEIIIKEEISDEDRNQCRLCLSVGRKMQELGDYAPLYRKLLFENNFQNTTIPSFMYQMLACWECHAELRRVKRFQDKVRRANAAFETNQNQKSENMSNLSTIIIGEYNNSGAGPIGRVSDLEQCAQDIKEEAIEAEVEETSVPDPLEVGQEVSKTEEVVAQIEPEPNITQKVAKRSRPQPKTSTTPQKRARIEQSDPKTSQDQENNPKPIADAESAIFAKVKIEIDELENILAERRNKESFKAMKFKCDSCILGFTDQYRLRDHNKNFHDEDVGSCECNICERRFDDESQMQAHFRNHFVKFVCKLCQFECYTKTGRTVHYKRHAGPPQSSSLLEQRLTTKQQAARSGSSLEPST